MEDYQENGEQGEEQGSQERTEVPEGQDYKNIAEMEEEDLADWARDDPKGYAANLARQIRSEVGKERDMSAFARDHEDFIGLHQSGVLDDLCRANPELKGNLISAYLVHKHHDGRLGGEYLKKHGADRVIAERLSERKGVRKARSFGSSDCQPTMPEDM